MICVIKKHLGINVANKMLAQEMDKFDFCKFVCYKYMMVDAKIKFGYIRERGLSAYTNLLNSIDDIYKTFSPTCRNEVNRSKRDGVVCSIFENKTSFVDFYNDFARFKHLSEINIADIDKYSDSVFFSQAVFEGEFLAMHALLVDEQSKCVLLLYSANTRFLDNKMRAFISKANRLLHYFELEYFKNIGFAYYDWGGLASKDRLLRDQELQGVNNFKLSFGCNVVDSNIYMSLPFFLISKCKKVFSFYGK